MSEGLVVQRQCNSSYATRVRKSPAEAARPEGGPEKGFLNRRFKRVFGSFLHEQKGTARPGRGAPGYRTETTPAAGQAAKKKGTPL